MQRCLLCRHEVLADHALRFALVPAQVEVQGVPASHHTSTPARQHDLGSIRDVRDTQNSALVPAQVEVQGVPASHHSIAHTHTRKFRAHT